MERQRAPIAGGALCSFAAAASLIVRKRKVRRFGAVALPLPSKKESAYAHAQRGVPSPSKLKKGAA